MMRARQADGGSRETGLPRGATRGQARGGLQGALALWLALLAIAGCTKAPPPAPDAVARVGHVVITTAQLEAEMKRRAQPPLPPPPAAKVLDELIDQEAAYQQAMATGFAQKPEIQQAVRRLIVARYREVQLAQAATPGAVKPEEARRQYELSKVKYRKPATVNAAVIVLECPQKALPEKRAEAMQKAMALREKAVAEGGTNRHFGQLALDHSTDQATRYRGGDLGWLTLEQARARLPAVVAEHLFQPAKSGDISSPIAAGSGIYLVKHLGRREEEIRPFDEVRPLIENELMRQRMVARDARQHEQLRQGVTIEINQALLQRCVSNLTAAKPTAPPSMPQR